MRLMFLIIVIAEKSQVEQILVYVTCLSFIAWG